MIDSDIIVFEKMLSAIYDLYGKAFSKFAVKIWWDALKAYDIRQVSEALSAHVKNPDSGQFLPKPADVAKMLGGTTADKAMLAWTKVETAVRLVGIWNSIVFDDPIIHMVITDMGGWITLCSKTDREWPYVRNDFIARYRGMTINPTAAPYQAILVGQFEAANLRMGYPVEPPLLFGNLEKAKQVMLHGANTFPPTFHIAGFLGKNPSDSEDALQLTPK